MRKTVSQYALVLLTGVFIGVAMWRMKTAGDRDSMKPYVYIAVERDEETRMLSSRVISVGEFNLARIKQSERRKLEAEARREEAIAWRAERDQKEAEKLKPEPKP